MKFRIIVGEHSEGSQTYYAHKEGATVRNDVVESDRNLVALFPNKFKRYAPAPHDALPVVAQQEPALAEDED